MEDRHLQSMDGHIMLFMCLDLLCKKNVKNFTLWIGMEVIYTIRLNPAGKSNLNW